VALPGTPKSIIEKINADVNEALRQPELQDRLKKLSAEIFGGPRRRRPNTWVKKLNGGVRRMLNCSKIRAVTVSISIFLRAIALGSAMSLPETEEHRLAYQDFRVNT
jgi:hypothetical protein